MKITTEGLLTSPDGFGLTTATPVQRAACRVRDGLSLGDLREHPDVQSAFGGAEAVSRLPSEQGIKPTAFYNVASARTAKTTMAVAAAIVDSQTIDVAGLGHGEIPRLSILSLKLDVADVPFRRLVDTIKASRLLRPLLIGEPTANMVRVRHPSGSPIEIAVVAGGKAAGSLVARWSAGLIADEAPRMLGREDGVANLDDAMSATRERLLPGAQIMCIGSPWAPAGPVYDAVQEHFGKPAEHIVVMRTTGPAGNPRYWSTERLSKLREADEVAWRINALGEFLDPESGLLSPVAVRRSTRDVPLELPPERGGRYAAAVDPAEGHAKGNAWTLVIVKKEPAGAEKEFRVALAREWRGLRPDACWEQIAAVCARYGLRRARTDQYAASANADLAKRYGLSLDIRATTAGSKLEDFTNLATLIHTDCIELPPDRQFRSDLLTIRKRTTQAGHTIVLPKTSDGRHCDFAPALAAAVRGATTTVHSGEYGKQRSSAKDARKALRPRRGSGGLGNWYPPKDRGNTNIF